MSQLYRAMLLLILFLLEGFTKAEFPVKCSNESHRGTTFESSTDGVKGRYNVEWCISANLLDNVVAKENSRAEWKMLVSYSVLRNETNCNKLRGPTKHKHSEVTESFDWYDLNCTSNVCFSTQLDLIFTGCYVVENWLPVLGSKRSITTQYITNDLTYDSLVNNKVKVNYVPHDDYVSIQWHLGNITASQYDMKLQRNNTISGKEEADVSITEKCSIAGASNVIACSLRGLNGSYSVYLAHRAPWRLGDFNSLAFSHYTFECVPPPSTELTTSSGSLVWACAALAAAAAAAGLAAAVWRWRGAATFRKRVLADWRQRLAEGPGPGAAGPGPGAAGPGAAGGGPVLLLYAREAPAAPLVAALAALLDHSQVWDLFSAEQVARSAAAPDAWLRAALARRDVRVVLLQTPALAALYCTAPAATEAPLLARRALRPPAPGDALLALALRLLAAETAPLPYTKYYLATVSGVETETLPYTVPFRRYVLPADGARLRLDLGGGRARAAPLAALRRAAEHFAQLVAARPHYLADQLLLLD